MPEYFKFLKGVIVLKRQFLIVGVLVGCLTGCSATHQAISKRNLDVQTKMSSSIFLHPVSPEKRTVFVQVKNSSDKPNLNISHPVRSLVEKKGYRVVDDPEKAQYLLQANILQAGHSDLSAAQEALRSGYGSAVPGAVVGAAIGSLSHSDNAAILGGLIGAAAATVADSMMKDVTYSVIVDVQVSEKAQTGIREKRTSTLKQGERSNTEQYSVENTQWRRYQTRIIGTANKVNLSFEEAEPKLVAGITQTLAGVL